MTRKEDSNCIMPNYTLIRIISAEQCNGVCVCVFYLMLSKSEKIRF